MFSYHMEEFKDAIEKFQLQEREKIKQEFRDKLNTLTQKVEELTKENARIYQKVTEATKSYQASLLSLLEEKTDSPDAKTQSSSEENLENFHSIKDRIKYMNRDPENFSNQLSTIGKKMAEYYRKSHNDEEPSKRDEKINDKHTLPVCVYAKCDWEYMDYLIKTSINLE